MFAFPLDCKLLDVSVSVWVLPSNTIAQHMINSQIFVPWTDQKHYGILILAFATNWLSANLIKSIYKSLQLGTDEQYKKCILVLKIKQSMS